MNNAQSDSSAVAGLSNLTGGPNVQTEVCECCQGIGTIKDTEFVDGDERSCMTCNGSGHFTYIPDAKASEDALIEKWFWKMEYCNKRRIPPAQQWAWEEADAAFAKAHNVCLSNLQGEET